MTRRRLFLNESMNGGPLLQVEPTKNYKQAVHQNKYVKSKLCQVGPEAIHNIVETYALLIARRIGRIYLQSAKLIHQELMHMFFNISK